MHVHLIDGKVNYVVIWEQHERTKAVKITYFGAEGRAPY